jgi:alpha-glucuronidase
VRAIRRTWGGVAGRIDTGRPRAVAERLATQERVARWWRDASLLYFQQFARKPIPPQYERPARPLKFYTAHTNDQIPDF